MPVVSSARSLTTAAFLRWQLVALWLATAVAAWLRLQDLGTWSLWVDEAHTWRDATMDLEGYGVLDSDRRKYPLGWMLLRSLIDTIGLGEDEFSMRLPFAVIGTLTVPLLGSCGRRLVGPGAAVLSAWFLALHPWHVFWSQNARAYVVVVLAAVLVTSHAVRFVEGWRLRDAAVVLLGLLLGAGSHPTAALLGIGLAVAWCAHLVRRWPPLAIGGALVAAAVVLWFSPQFGEVVFPEFFKSKRGASIDHFLRTSAFYFRPALLLAAAAGALLVTPRWGARWLVLIAGAVAPFVMLLPTAHEVKVTARFAIATLPCLLWLAAFACVRIASTVSASQELPARVRIVAAALVPLLMLGELGQQLVDYYGVQQGQRGPWKRATEFLRAKVDGAPLRVMTVNHATMLYYLRPGHWRSAVPDGDVGNHVSPLLAWMWENGWNELKKPSHEPGLANHFTWQQQQAKAAKARFAVMVSLPELIEEDRSSALRVHLANHFELVGYFPCWIGPKDESVYVYLPKLP